MNKNITNTYNVNNKPCIFHIDMDAFYVSVECFLNPELKGKPVVVGHDSERSVISAASYEARKYGVFSAMSVVKAKKLCPDLIFVYSGMEYYMEVSRRIMLCIKEFSPVVEVVGCDEAYIDVTGIWKDYGSAYKMAEVIQKKVAEDCGGLTCSIGIAPLRFMAKIASDLNKPNGIAEIKEEEMYNFLTHLDLYKIPFVGKKFLAKLHSFGIYTAGEARQYSKDFFERTFGKAGLMLYDRVNAIDETPVVGYYEAKSESAEITLPEDTRNRDILKNYLREHAERIGAGLRSMEKKAQVITLKIKFSDFTSISRQITLPRPTFATKTIYEVGCHLLDKEELNQDVRLIGLGASQFEARIKTEQISLFDEIGAGKKEDFNTDIKKEEERENLDKVKDAIKNKYGSNSIV